METSSQQLCDDLLSFLGRIKSAITISADRYDLTPVQLYALYAIAHGETSMGRLAASLRCDASNVTGIVDRLVAQGLVSSHTAPSDRRAKVLSLETSGNKIISNFVDELSEYIGCPSLSATERSELHGYLAKLAA